MQRKQNPDQVLQYKQVASCVEGFAPLPSVAMRVLDLMTDPDTTVADLEEVLQGDVSLVAGVLKLANSAFYGLRRQVDSLRHALTLLGKSEVQNLILMNVLFRSFKATSSLQQGIMSDIWRHALETATAAEAIGAVVGEESPLLFLGGMLHDIGKVLIVSEFFVEVEKLDSYGVPGGLTDEVEEQQVFGCSHAKLGSQLLFRWLFPVHLVDIVAQHHDYDTIAEKETTCRILILANLLSCQVTLTDWDHVEENRENELAQIQALLLRCGEDSGLLPDTESLETVEQAYRKRLEDRKDLLELMAG